MLCSLLPNFKNAVFILQHILAFLRYVPFVIFSCHILCTYDTATAPDPVTFHKFLSPNRFTSLLHPLSSPIMAAARPKYNTKDIAKVKEVDDNQVAEVKQWMETIMGEQYTDFFDDIRDGVELCKLLNKIKPNLIAEKKFKKSKIVFVARTNIQLFIEGCKKLGIPETDCFETRFGFILIFTLSFSLSFCLCLSLSFCFCPLPFLTVIGALYIFRKFAVNICSVF